MKKVMLLISWFLLSSTGALAASAQEANCLLKIETKYRAGEIKNEQKELALASKDLCKAEAKKLSQNFDRALIQEVKVRHTWREVRSEP